MLYLKSLGGPFFYMMAYSVMLVFNFTPIINNGFLAYWSGKYNDLPMDEVPVKT